MVVELPWEKVVSLCDRLGFKLASQWSDQKMKEKLKQVVQEVMNCEGEPPDLDEEQRDLLVLLGRAFKEGKEICIVRGGEELCNREQVPARQVVVKVGKRDFRKGRAYLAGVIWGKVGVSSPEVTESMVNMLDQMVGNSNSRESRTNLEAAYRYIMGYLESSSIYRRGKV